MNGVLKYIRRCYENVGRKNIQLVKAVQNFQSCHVKGFDTLNFIAKKMNPKAIIGIPRKNINGIPFDTEISSVKLSFGPRIETLNQLMKQFSSRNDLTFLQTDDILFEFNRVSNTVQTRYRGHYNHISASR